MAALLPWQARRGRHCLRLPSALPGIGGTRLQACDNSGFRCKPARRDGGARQLAPERRAAGNRSAARDIGAAFTRDAERARRLYLLPGRRLGLLGSPSAGPPSARTSRRLQREAHVPTAQPQAVTSARVPPSHVHPGGPRDHQRSPTQGPSTAERLIDSCRSRADFAAFRRGRRVSGDLMWLSFAPDGGLARPRVAFALSRRAGTAVARNRARRRLRALFSEFARDLAPGRYLIGTRSSAQFLTYRRSRAELLRLWSAAGALRGSAER